MSYVFDKNLIFAAKGGDVADVERALQAGADIHTEDGLALRTAANNGHLGVVKQLLIAGADIHADDDAALHWAAVNGHLAVIDFLIKSGADITAREDLALRLAANNGQPAVVDLLLISGANITALPQTSLSAARITTLLKRHAVTAHRGFETVAMLKPTSRMAVLRHIFPDLTPKQIRDEISMMQALGLNAAQSGEMWQARCSAATTKPETAVFAKNNGGSLG